MNLCAVTSPRPVRSDGATPCGSSSATITIEREVILAQGKGGQPTAIIQTSDHGFIVTGNVGGAWASRLDSTGKVVWEYSDSGAELNGAVNLPDDSTLLCGKDYESTSKGQIYYGFLVHLDLSGKELSKDHWYLTTDQTYMKISAIFDLSSTMGRRSRAGRRCL